MFGLQLAERNRGWKGGVLDQEASVAPQRTIQRQNSAVRAGTASRQLEYLVSLFRIWPSVHTLKHFGCQNVSTNCLVEE
jgi:hypothetical protein